MNITVNSEILAAELRHLNRVVPDKAALAVLSSIVFRVVEAEPNHPNTLYLSATDMAVSMESECPAMITEPGEIAIPAKKLGEILEQVGNVPVTLATEKNHVRLTAGAFKSRIQCFSPADFPGLPAMEGDVYTVSAPALAMLIDRVEYAISEKTSNYVLKGALFSLIENVFAMVATDSKRLSIATANYVGNANLSVTIPDKTLPILAAHCTGARDIEFSCNGKHLFFLAGKRLLSSQMLEGKFPNYERVIPKDNNNRAMVDRNVLIGAMRRVILMAEEREPGIGFRFTKGALVVTSQRAGMGDADENMAANYEGPETAVIVNGKYVLEFLEHAAQPMVTIDMGKPEAPFLFTDGQEFINVLMGMR